MESTSLISIFLPRRSALSRKSFGSPILTIGTLKSHHFFEAANLIIKSGPIPAGSPGE